MSARVYTSRELRDSIADGYLEENLTEREIARRLGVSHSTVHYWIRRLDRGASLDTAHKPGRPRATRPDEDAGIVGLSSAEPFAAATDIRSRLELRCCATTVRNRLREGGLRCRRPAKKELLKPVHRTKRLAFALNHHHWEQDRWNGVVFSDEKLFCSSGHGPMLVWRPAASRRHDERYVSHSKNRSGRFTVAVWACISAGGGPTEIHRIRRSTLNAESYIGEVLEPIVQDRLGGLVFMQDLSSIHTSNAVRRWFQNNDVELMEDWPPKGADMNPTENVWAEMERRLADRKPTNADGMWEMVRDEFRSLGRAYVESLFGSMHRRMNAVMEAEGGWTRY